MCETLPFVGMKRLVVVHDVEELNEEGLKVVKNYVKSPSEFTILVLLSTETDIRLPLSKTGIQIKCWKPFEDYAARWIVEKASAYGKRMSIATAEYLNELFGGDLDQIDSEISKLVMFVSDRKDIATEDVEKVRSSFSDINPFNLANAIAERNRAKTFAIFERLYSKKENMVKVLGAISNHFRQLLILKIYLTEEKLSLDEAAHKMNTEKKRMTFRAISSQQRFFSIEFLRKSLSTFSKMDEILKSSDEVVKKIQFENMLMDLSR